MARVFQVAVELNGVVTIELPDDTCGLPEVDVQLLAQQLAFAFVSVPTIKDQPFNNDIEEDSFLDVIHEVCSETLVAQTAAMGRVRKMCQQAKAAKMVELDWEYDCRDVSEVQPKDALTTNTKGTDDGEAPEVPAD